MITKGKVLSRLLDGRVDKAEGANCFKTGRWKRSLTRMMV